MENKRTVKFTKYALISLGAALMAYTLFYISITSLGVGQILCAGVALAFVAAGIFIKRLLEIRWLVIALGVICALGIALLAFLGIYGNIDNTDHNEDVVIVLGCGIKGERLSIQLRMRLDETVRYHEKNPDAVIVVSGGQGKGEDISEALAMERYLISNGVPAEKIIKEDRSTSTRENLRFSKSILDEKIGENEYSAVIITSGYHTYRANEYAKKEGIKANHVGAPIEWFGVPACYMRECLAVLKLWILD